ncbi:MAG: 1,3-beta-galactosyl-N-acetylhexosamine phosphorylase [Clostridiales bacterium]|nr:1,3-beta-galactosyl-N-acetylhexosamine phosphorylase [Clostridiales bacterium]
MNKGRVTIPTDENYVEGTKEIAKLWGADAVRDCDGTKLPKNALEIAEKVYNTYFVVRGDNAWADKHTDELQSVLLMTGYCLATEETLTIDLLKGYSRDQLGVNEENPNKYWQVFDRTTGEEIFTWEYVGAGHVRIENAKPYHEYTVNFFAKNLWDSTQMYNYITNNWNIEKHKVMDTRFSATFEHIKDNMRKWCDENKNVNVVRYTTFLYHFFLVFNEINKEKHVDWFGYPMTASPKAFDAFEKEYGYMLKTEDIVAQGTYQNNFVNPTETFRDYMEFTEKYVTKTVRELVDIIHAEGKEAMMFLGDSWIGTEPYGDYFKDMQLDAVVGSVGGGVTVRMLSEIPHVKYHEGRFLPYFFPDTFFEGNEDNAVAELNRNWVTARRAMMRKPLERMGFGGYLSLAAKFPKFIERAGQVCDEFRSICDASDGGKPYSGLTVAVLNAWGKKRSWMCHMVAHELWYQQVYSYQGVYEALSGLGVAVRFISFDDIKQKGIDKDIDVILNVGDAGTAFSGGEYWNDEQIVTAVRKWVAAGHGFIGVGEPTAYQKGCKFFQLSDVLGVDKEKGFTLSEDKYNIERKAHFITADVQGEIDFGEGMKNVYALNKAQVLDISVSNRFVRKVNVGEVNLAVNEYGNGRGVYIAGLPYSPQNARILLRAMLWSAHKETELTKAYSSNVHTDCSYYPESKRYAVINNADYAVKTTFYDIDGNAKDLSLKAGEIVWL